MLTSVATALRYTIELRILATFFALVTLTEANKLQMLQAAFLGRETVLELAKGGAFFAHAIV